MTSTTTSAPPNAHDRLRSLYASPGPYTSAYLPCGEFAEKSPLAAFDEHKHDLFKRGSSQQALDALHARLTLPLPDDVGGWALHVADDGSTAVDFAPEGPAEPIMYVGDLPMAAPLLEWDQWRIPHITVSIGADTGEIVSFLPRAEPASAPLPSDTDVAIAAIRHVAISEELRLVMVIGEGGDSAGFADQLREVVPPNTNVVEVGQQEWSTVDDVVNVTVRYVADVVARDTVRSLEDFRFMVAGGNGVEGTAAVFDALTKGHVQSLLVHDDPTDPSSASFGTQPTDVSAAYEQFDSIGRRVDVAIWSALQQGVDIRVIPSTSSSGPAENIGAVLVASTDDTQGAAQ